MYGNFYFLRYSWRGGSFGKHGAFYYELPPYLDLNYSNQDKQSKNTEKYTKIKTNAHTESKRADTLETCCKKLE